MDNEGKVTVAMKPDEPDTFFKTVEDVHKFFNPADPHHYKTKSMECRDIIKVMTEGLNGVDAYYMGNVLKYLYRYADKNGTEDLDKAITYISFLKGE